MAENKGKTVATAVQSLHLTQELSFERMWQNDVDNSISSTLWSMN